MGLTPPPPPRGRLFFLGVRMMGYHDFESDDERALAHIPLAMRYRLDQSGIKLTLKQWQALPMALRRRAIQLPCDTDDAIDDFQHELAAYVRGLLDADVIRFKVMRPFPWRLGSALAELNQALGESHCPQISDDTWGQLNDFQRYVLIAFARPGRVSSRLPSAFREFYGTLPPKSASSTAVPEQMVREY